jgi:hypothetical protein
MLKKMQSEKNEWKMKNIFFHQNTFKKISKIRYDLILYKQRENDMFW